ncbi:acetoin utilization protein AcuC [Miniimonas arenae]|uniref:acetoin utilization protein AcuC n=1 Tax=Miniimonas arenae TaxID=676201 RepID=UPI0028B09080|nr:acetoin utilization protein AcuC [Miniimonas arenae]
MADAPRAHRAPDGPTAFVWSDDLLWYDFGPGHPMAPVRIELTRDLVRALALPDVVEIGVEDVDDDLLTLVHDPAFVEAVKAGARGEPDEARGIGTEDTPMFPEMHAAAARTVGSTLAAARWVWSGAGPHAVSVAGGMHHAMPDRASGFCVYNDVAVSIRWLLAQGAERVAYVDLDAHHGDGVERAFWDDPRVLTISVHESGLTLFPGTGFASDVGGSGAEGYAVNVALPARTRGNAWLRAVEAIVAPLLAEFAPDVLVSQHGADSHMGDPMTNLRVSVDHQLAAAVLMRDLASAHAGNRWIATGGGGYTVVEVVPRVWAGLTAIAAGAAPDLDAELPRAWVEEVESRLRIAAPQHWSDGLAVELKRFAEGYDPADDVDRTILATRTAVFPLHGLDPSW